jgi:replicative DNA helicase
MNEPAFVPPQNTEAEDSILSAILQDAATIDIAADAGLRPEDFYKHGNSLIFSAALNLHARDESIDAITLTDELTTLGTLERVGGKDRIKELSQEEVFTAHVKDHASIVHEMSVLRTIIDAGQYITRLGLERPGDLDDIIAKADAAITAALVSSAQDAKALTEDIDELISEIREAYTTGVAIRGTLTGLSTLDDMLGGLWPGQFVILAARPSTGKSTLGLNIAENVAAKGDTVLFLSLEMGLREFQLKSLARAARVNSKVLGAGATMTPSDAERLGTALPEWKSKHTNLIVHDVGTATIATVRAEANKLKRLQNGHALSLIVVDYLQLMAGDDPKNRQQEVSLISRGLKQLARKLNVPIIGISQMNRNIDSRAHKRPVLSDLRESGALEQDADVVMFLHDEAAQNPDQENDGTVEVIVAKQRHGETGETKLAFNRAYSTFKDIGGGPQS